MVRVRSAYLAALGVVAAGLVLSACGSPSATVAGPTLLPPASDGPLHVTVQTRAKFVLRTQPPTTAVAVSFVSDAEGWLVGAPATSISPGPVPVMHSVDGGRTWIRRGWLPAQPSTLHFVDPEHGFATAGNLLYTTLDGGRSWGQVAANLSQVSFATAEDGVALLSGNGAVATTTDGGNTWTQVLSRTGVQFVSVSAPTSEELFALGDTASGPVLFRSDDGGSTWSLLFSGVSAPGFAGAYQAYLRTFRNLGPARPTMANGGNVVFTGSDTGWMVLFDGSFLSSMYARTTDGGQTWTYAWGNHGCAMGCNGAGMGLEAAGFSGAEYAWRYDGQNVDRTSDGGQTWQGTPLRTGIPVQIAASGADFVDAQHGYLATSSGLYGTTDGGAHWAHLWPNTVGALSSLSLQPDGQGFGVGSTLPDALWTTSDYGRTWQALRSFPAIRSLGRLPGGGGWVFDGKSLWRTRNGGSTWTSVPMHFPKSRGYGLAQLQMASLSDGWYISPGRKLYGTTDGGQTWRFLHVLPEGPAVLDPLPGGRGWRLIGEKKPVRSPSKWGLRVQATADGGRGFRTLGTMPLISGPTALDFVSPSQGALIGSTGLWVTADMGRTWQDITWSSDTGDSIFASEVQMVSSQTLYLLTGDGRIFFTTDGGSIWYQIH